YLHLHGPATLTEAAGFMTTTKGVAKDVWPGELADVELNGKRVFLAQQDISALENPPEPDFVRLLPPSDPLLQARDRLTLVPNKANRKAIWRIIGNPGVVLDGGEIVATWRAAAKGRKRLGVTVSPLWTLRRSVRAAVETEAARVAGARDFDAIAVTFE
ncbi:MAG: DNA glycosylase AlkZ-like family protein, partial [Pseudonocardiaceae bacterium]